MNLSVTKMAITNNNKRQFKHPIVPVQNSNEEEIPTISAEQLVEATEDSFQVNQVRWRNMTLYIRNIIEMDEVLRFTSSVLDVCTGDGYYMIEMIDFAFRCAVIGFYSNVHLPADNDKKYSLLYGTDLYQVVKDHISEGQFNALRESIHFYLTNT